MHFIVEEIDEDTSMEELQKMMLVALVYRILVCFYEVSLNTQIYTVLVEYGHVYPIIHMPVCLDYMYLGSWWSHAREISAWPTSGHM